MICLYLIVKQFWKKSISKILTSSLEILYCQECSNNFDDTSIFTIEIVGKFRSISKFILRDIHKKMKSYVIKNARIDCDKDTYDVLNNSIAKPFNEEMKLLMNKDMFMFFMWNKNKNIIIKYLKEEDMKKSSYNKIIQIQTRFFNF